MPKITKLYKSGAIIAVNTTLTFSPNFNFDDAVRIDASAGNITITLPLLPNAIYKKIGFVREDTTSNTITISGNGATINNLATTTIPTGQFQSIVVFSNRTKWIQPLSNITSTFTESAITATNTNKSIVVTPGTSNSGHTGISAEIAGIAGAAVGQTPIKNAAGSVDWATPSTASAETPLTVDTANKSITITPGTSGNGHTNIKAEIVGFATAPANTTPFKNALGTGFDWLAQTYQQVVRKINNTGGLSTFSDNPTDWGNDTVVTGKFQVGFDGVADGPVSTLDVHGSLSTNVRLMSEATLVAGTNYQISDLDYLIINDNPAVNEFELGNPASFSGQHKIVVNLQSTAKAFTPSIPYKDFTGSNSLVIPANSSVRLMCTRRDPRSGNWWQQY